jgi:hypothetical protein
MCVGVSGCVENNSDKKEETKKVEQAELEWPDDGISKVLPKPDAKTSEIGIDSDDSLLVYIKDITKSDYEKYKGECEKKGFTNENDELSDKYTAFNKEGYKLEITYFEGTKDYWIDLKAPIKIGTLNWPKSGTATLLPTPKSDKGTITDDSSNFFIAFVGDTNYDGFKAYGEECRNVGFNVDYNNSEKFYRAKNKKGDSIDVSYEGFKIMRVAFRGAEDKKPEKNEAKEKPVDDSKKTPSESDSSKFKKAMDSYEKLVDDYVDFMKKYSESGNSLEMINEYTEYMEKYTDAMEKINDVDTSKLSKEDALYYTKVTARIAKKISEIQ